MEVVVKVLKAVVIIPAIAVLAVADVVISFLTFFAGVLAGMFAFGTLIILAGCWITEQLHTRGFGIAMLVGIAGTMLPVVLKGLDALITALIEALGEILVN